MKFNRLFLIFSLVLFSCGSDDSDSDTNGGGGDCPKTPTDQVAQGNFRGTAFTSPGGSYFERTGPTGNVYQCTIFVSEKTGGSCIFPDFKEGNKTILFSIDELEPQTITVSNSLENNNSTLNFNSISTGTDIETIAELSCGVIDIKTVDTDKGEISGSVIATGVDGSKIDGNFTLTFCDKEVF